MLRRYAAAFAQWRADRLTTRAEWWADVRTWLRFRDRWEWIRRRRKPQQAMPRVYVGPRE